VLKNALWSMSAWSGLNRFGRLRHRHRLLSLCYHNVWPEGDMRSTFSQRNTIGLAAFGAHLEAIAQRFRFVTADEVLAARHGRPLAPHSVLLTFDDGFASWADHVAPLLYAMGIPAHFFVTTEFLRNGLAPWYQELVWLVESWPHACLPWPTGAPRSLGTDRTRKRDDVLRLLNRECKSLDDSARCDYLELLRADGAGQAPAYDREVLAPLRWDGVRQLHRLGFGIGSHTVTHPILSRLTRQALDRELCVSKAEIEQVLGRPCRFLAYPNGAAPDVSSEVLARAGAAGYELAFTTRSAFDDPARDPLAIGRACVPASMRPRHLLALAGGWLH
jgi:peptidoglycan/xylan/chitin deacetylase (PgdA/CDA1 family)